MAKKSSEKIADEARAAGDPVPVSEATDGGDSRLTKGYEDNPDKPDPTTVGQVEVLHDEEPGA